MQLPTPDILYGYQGQQPTLAVDTRQVNHPVGPALPLFAAWLAVGKGFQRKFSRTYALQDRRSYLAPERSDPGSFTPSCQITKAPSMPPLPAAPFPRVWSLPGSTA